MADAAVEAHWNEHIVVDQWGNSVFKHDTPGCHFCDALSGRLARRRNLTSRPGRGANQ